MERMALVPTTERDHERGNAQHRRWNATAASNKHQVSHLSTQYAAVATRRHVPGLHQPRQSTKLQTKTAAMTRQFSPPKQKQP